MKKLTIKIEGRGHEPADFSDFASLSQAVAESLLVTHRRLFPKQQKRPRYRIIDLHMGSAVATVAPVMDGANEFLNSYQEALSAIRNGVLPEGRVSTEHLRSYKKLAGVLDSHSKRVIIGNVEITGEFAINCDLLIERSPKSLGQVTGFLQGVNTHKRTCFRLYPEGQSYGAECYLCDDSLFQEMLKAFDKRVRLTGLIRRDPDGLGVAYVEVHSLEVMPEPSEIPTLASLAGIWKDTPLDLDEIRASWNE